MAERSEEVQLRIKKDRNLAFLHEIYSSNEHEAFRLLETDELIEIDFTTSDGETGLHLACRNQLLRLTKELILRGWNYGFHCRYRNTRPYSELLPFDEESNVVQHIRKEQELLYITNNNLNVGNKNNIYSSPKTNDYKKSSSPTMKNNETYYETKINNVNYYSRKSSSPNNNNNIIQEVFRIYEGPIPYIILVFTKLSPGFVVGDTIGAPADKLRQIYIKNLNTVNGITFIRWKNKIDENNLLKVEFVCTVKTKSTLKFKCLHHNGTYRFMYVNNNNNKNNESSVDLIEGKYDNLNIPTNLHMTIITATTITLEWDGPNEKDVIPHRYYVTLKSSRKASNDDDDSITKILFYPAFKVKFDNLKPQGSYYFSFNAERCGHHTPESPTIKVKTAIAPIRPATIYENRLLYFACEDGDVKDIKHRLETCIHEIAYDRHFIHDEKTGETAIHGAAKFGRGPICKYLLLKGWKLQRFPPIVNEDDKGVIDMKDEKKKSPKKSPEQRSFAKVQGEKGRQAVYKENAELWFLAEKGDIEAIEYMLKDELQNIVYDRKFCYQISKGETALHIAAKNGHKGLTEFLISKKWDPEDRNYRRQSAGGLAHQFLQNVRNGRDERNRKAEAKMKLFLKKRYTAMADSASKGFDWINKHTDGRLGGKYVLTEMQKLIMSNNPTWSMQEKRHDLMRREKRDRNRVSLGIKVLDRLKALEAYPMYTISNFKTLITRVQDAGDGTYVTWPKRLAIQYERTLQAYEQRDKMKLIANRVQEDGRCWRCKSVLYPVKEDFDVNEPRCQYCWGREGGFMDSFLRETRL